MIEFTLEYMNGWLKTHKAHQIAFYRRRHADAFVAPRGYLAVKVPQKIILSLSCTDCGDLGFVVDIEDDEGQDITA